MPFLSNPFDYTASMKPLDGYTNAQNDALERALMLFAEALQEPENKTETSEEMLP